MATVDLTAPIALPSILRSRVALLALLGAFLIPIGMSSLRGLTHVLTCRDEARTPFTLIVPPAGSAPEAVTSTTFGRDTAGICGGLSLDLGTRAVTRDRMEMVVPITNNSEHLWQGTVKLVLDGTTIPVDIGEVDAGSTETDSVTLDLERGSHELTGSVLIGP
ncbi:MAG TPA: hypothetical protein VHK89_01115 [Actinomycetota bacterium]|jgi:hypothetical protein|nr:hypothetical protein [Actinomycetota bacterium]